MSRIVAFVFVLGGVLVLAAPLTSFAQNKSSSSSSAKSSQAMTAARQQVTAAQQSLAQAASFLKESDTKFHYQTRHVSTVRSKVFEEYDKNGSLEDARHKVDKLEKELAVHTKPILALVHAQPEYKALAKRHAEAELLIKEGAETENSRDRLLKEVMSLQTEMRQMEKEKLVANTEAKGVWTQLQEARAQVKELCGQRDQQISQDSKMNEAVSELQSAKQSLDQAKVAVVTEKQKLAAAEQLLSQAMAASRASSNRGRGTSRRRN